MCLIQKKIKNVSDTNECPSTNTVLKSLFFIDKEP